MRSLNLSARMCALSVLLLLPGCEERVNLVELVIPSGGRGFTCVDSNTGGLLVQKAVQRDGSAVASLVLDYLDLGGVPSCRPSALIRWCDERGCAVSHRDCVRLRLDTIPAAGEVVPTITTELNRLGSLTDDAPDGVVLVRAILATQTCEELEPVAGIAPAMSCDGLIGCVYSCPVQLDEVQGHVELELDTAGTCDETVVRVCAGLGEGTCVPSP